MFSGRGSMRPLLARQFPGAEIEVFDLSPSGDREPRRILAQRAGERFLSARKDFDLICSNGSLELLPSLRAWRQY